MGEIVEFPAEEELGYWLCNCGCNTFYVRTDHEVECAHCGDLASGLAGGGYIKIPEPEKLSDRPDEINHVVILDNAEMAIKHVLKKQSADNMRALIVLWADGHITTWCRELAETRKQRGWLRRGLECARKTLVAR